MAKETYGYNNGFPTVEPFGSFVMDMFTPKSDLDLSLNFIADETSSFPRERKISALRKFAKVLYAHQRKGNVFGVLPIMRARVPVLKVVDRGTGIECDISVENKDGISRSMMINLMCLVDGRFRILCFLTKVWAKAHRINSSKDHTLSSLSITLLVAFHLQTRDPPILPPFSALLRDGQQPISVQKVVHEFRQFGRENKESLAELFVSLLSKLSSVRSLWELGLCASTYEGSWISKNWGFSNVGVEDFLDRSQNCARAVGKLELPQIYECIDRSLDHLLSFRNGYMEGSDLKVLLFGPVSLHTRQEDAILSGLGNPKRSFPYHDSLTVPSNNTPLPKKMRYTEPIGRPSWPESQILSSYPQSFVPGQLNYRAPPQPGTRGSPKPAYWSDLHPPPPSTPPGPYMFDHLAHAPSASVGPNLYYGSERYPPLPADPLAPRSYYQL
ncbi:unnamed protein product [Spirodela intermedia]|uniref:Poly(A) RNA polymerase mitochondrial-like central palm domain-containing protein n=1 Tax=Spirodela intermedia TaxID=51605 RepID=A0A7I8J008_SPIIN|nr:unnamed protein product [Spirodela intermedia]CAA6662640.1 unnamed protein product [Spirodela intermedia]